MNSRICFQSLRPAYIRSGDIMTNKTNTLDLRVFGAIEEKILSGEYKSGEQLTEMRLSSEFGVSRTPVREALAMLEREGLIELIPNKGAIVVGISKEDLVDIYSIRKRLEGLAASMAAERIGEKEKSELSEIVELSEFYIAKNDCEKLKVLDSKFHQAIYTASGSRMLEKVLSDLHRSISAYRKMSLSVPGRLELSVNEHKEILKSILDGDAKKADELTARHVESALDNLINKINEE